MLGELDKHRGVMDGGPRGGEGFWRTKWVVKGQEVSVAPWDMGRHGPDSFKHPHPGAEFTPVPPRKRNKHLLQQEGKYPKGAARGDCKA